ncbi:acyl-CoA dehydrogenase [Pelagibius litoralis]|uniref:3-methylmercaptopropionyl-CoA dehydrogenase n=1 Tax=Pelagibius litoralis TaxID=374515 RepID=A0A967F0J4_9PROT|nr:acyl-CoA dehydrogenase [Pelagibius litoralis]NIA70780.1 acyl-CoA dehydrogenase [Pelagibius litoralis]
MTYTAPITEMRFALDAIADMPGIAGLPGYEEATPDLVDAILEEAGKLGAAVLAPLNHPGDREGSVYENGVVRTPKGFQEAYNQFVEGGWNSLPFDPDYGGQGMPWTLATAVQEIWQAANLSFGLCPLLTAGAVELLQEHGSEDQKQTYLPRMISGEWTGTMNLTEPQAGSDVGAVKTKAEPNGDHYLITGQKIYITFGEHDLTENIVHMVLARLPDAPAGTKGISLFLVPKFLVNEDGTLGPRNDLRCVSIEHKLGIKASPTAVMAYGDSGGAIGYLVGGENRGMACMFTMMNNARLAVGIQGVAIAERAYQQARAYAFDRTQSRALDGNAATVAIIRHPDVRRMLATMKAKTEAARAMTYWAAAALDRSKREPDEEARRGQQALLDLLIPVTKSWCTDIGCEVASLGIQIHGGMGFVEETGAAQHYRDARILPIYEGTNGIQALDLFTRKLLRDEGAAMTRLLMEMRAGLPKAEADSALAALREPLAESLEALDRATAWMLEQGGEDLLRGAASATPYQNLFGVVLGGWLLAQAAIEAARRAEDGSGDQSYLDGKLKTARFYADNLLGEAAGLAAAVTKGAESTLALADEQF